MKNSKGVSLVEILLLVVAVGFIVLVLGNLPNSIRLIGKAKHQSLARELAAKAIEDKRAIQYANLSLGATTANLSSLPSGSQTVLVENCDISICTNAEDAKVITVIVSWTEMGQQLETKLVTLVAKGGLNE